MQNNQLEILEIITNKFKEIDQIIGNVSLMGYQFGILPALSVSIFLVLILLFFLKRKRKGRSVPQAEPPPAIIEETIEPIDEAKEIGEESIVEFFLNIYKIQLGETQLARGRFKLLDSVVVDARRTYELEVFHNKQWVSRRMSVGLAGDDSASRSKCFTVIYDDRFVIKVPQKPITNFENYITAIESDQEIVKKVSPRECIVPTVAAVLKMIRPFSESKQLTPEQLEEKYLDWLRKFPSFQAHLRIGDSYVFVMDLSRYFFLSHIINDFHDLPNKLYQEIVGYPDVIWENHGFEGRYAAENDEQLDALRKVYKAFEERSQILLNKVAKRKFPRYTLQEWFLIHLAGRQLEVGRKDLTPDRVEKINALLKKTLAENKDTIDDYRRTIRGCIQSVTVSQSMHQIAGLVTNLLDLLAWLRSKGVAMRDLKPDNLLIAGDKARYPEFLNTSENYSIGLIDVETAVVYGSDNNRQVPQPTLGGTPNYATPTHLMPNEILAACFQDAVRILYLQDWYALVGIIYEMITGERLFTQTGKLIIGIKNLMFRNAGVTAAQLELFKNTSRMFWHSARSEMAQKTGEKKHILQRVTVGLTDDVRALFLKELQMEKHCILRRIKETVAGQRVFMNEKTRRSLLIASRKKITQLKVKWNKAQPDGGKGLKILNDLEALKRATENNLQLTTLLEDPLSTVSADELIYFMFEVVQKAMYREAWGDLIPTEVVGVREGQGTTTVEATI
jgi:serine/threonine protein kinase